MTISSPQTENSSLSCRSLTKAELDKSWEKYQPLVVTCSDASIVSPIHGAKRNSSILLEFHSDVGEKYILYCNVISNKSGYAVAHNSKFARLYRLLTASNPVSRYSKAKQLLKHLIGRDLLVDATSLQSDGEVSYHKITKYSPVKEISSNEWDISGRLKPKIKKRRRSKPSQIMETGWKNNGKNQESKWKQDGKELERQNIQKLSRHVGCGDNLPRNNITTLPSSSVQSQSGHTEVMSAGDGSENVTRQKREESETIDDYYDRVISKTFF